MPKFKQLLAHCDSRWLTETATATEDLSEHVLLCRASSSTDQEKAMTSKLLTMKEACEELRVARSTMMKWRQRGCGPKFRKLENGQLRTTMADLEDFYETLELA